MSDNRLTGENAHQGRAKSESETLVSRRRMLQAAGGSLAAVALTGCEAAEMPPQDAAQTASSAAFPRMPDVAGRFGALHGAGPSPDDADPRRSAYRRPY